MFICAPPVFLYIAPVKINTKSILVVTIISPFYLFVALDLLYDIFL